MRRSLDQRADWRAALIACWVARAGGAKDIEIEDFLPVFEGEADDNDEPGQTWQEQLAIMEAMAARSKAQGEHGVRGNGRAEYRG